MFILTLSNYDTQNKTLYGSNLLFITNQLLAMKTTKKTTDFNSILQSFTMDIVTFEWKKAIEYKALYKNIDTQKTFQAQTKRYWLEKEINVNVLKNLVWITNTKIENETDDTKKSFCLYGNDGLITLLKTKNLIGEPVTMKSLVDML